MERSDLEPRFAPIELSHSFDFEKAAFDATARILRDKSFPTRTILCANDRIAFGVLAAMCQAEMKVGFGPDCDFRVAGHDNQRLSAYTCPPLTTVSQDCDEMGRVALRMLLEGIEGEELTGRNRGNAKILLNGELVLRKSA
jgi:DNA-binding LacI/PurR family transcriptional regulator